MDYSEFEMDNRCVVFYDSGTGGLRLFEKTRKAFPSENYVYFADEKYMPFGNKTKEELLIINKYEKYEILAAINIRQIIAITMPAILQAPYFLKFIHKVISAPTQSAA